MKKEKKNEIFFGFLAFFICSVFVFTQSRIDNRNMRPPKPPLISALDLDNNGIISSSEMENAKSSLLILDKNNDGQLSFEELRPNEQNRMGHGPMRNNRDSDHMNNREGSMENRPKPPIHRALDTDGDGTISSMELENAVYALKKLDKNDDGKLTFDELRPGSRNERRERRNTDQN